MVISNMAVEVNSNGKGGNPFSKGSGREINTSSPEVEFVLRNLPSVFRSNGTVEKFDPERIMSSLLAETTVPEETARQVTWEFVLKMLNSEHPVITAPFIREQLCTILFQRNPKWRYEYTRLGMPFRDFERISNGRLDNFGSSSEIGSSKDKILSLLDKNTIAEIVCRMAKDYIGVRKHIITDDDSIEM